MSSDTRLIQFLQQELAVSSTEIAVLLRRPEHTHDPLPMLLWQYGLISLQQLTQIFDWLEAQAPLNSDDWLLHITTNK